MSTRRLHIKAEFDSALADFNARLTTFEAGINSKIDSQVSSYLDRNGIWNRADQTVALESSGAADTYKWMAKGWREDGSIAYDGVMMTSELPTDEDDMFKKMLWRYIYCNKEGDNEVVYRKYLKDRNNGLGTLNGAKTIKASDTWILGDPKVLVQTITKSGLCAIKYQAVPTDSDARFGINLYNINYTDIAGHVNTQQQNTFTQFYPSLSLSSFVFKSPQSVDATTDWKTYGWKNETLTNLDYYSFDSSGSIGTRRSHVVEGWSGSATAYRYNDDNEVTNWGYWKVGLNTAPMQTFFFVSKDDKLWLTDAMIYNGPASNLLQAFWYNQWRLEGNNWGTNLKLEIGVY